MSSLWTLMRPMLGYLAVFSFCINLLFVVPAIFMLQVFDRVLPSNSKETLVVLLAGTSVALLLLLSLDYFRNRLQHALGNLVEEVLAVPVVDSIVKAMASRPLSAPSATISDINAFKSIFSSNGLIALFDAPWITVYVTIIWLFHPMLGVGAAISAAIMLVLAWMNDRVGRRAMEELQKELRQVSHYVESSLRNAEILQAMGMTRHMTARWQSMQDRASGIQIRVSRSNVAFGAITRISRQGIQIGMLTLGAYLVLTEQASPGVMIATTVLLGRAIQPVEQIVSSWRTVVDARIAYRRLRELLRDRSVPEAHVTMPRPLGLLSVDNISYRLPGTEKVLLQGVAFALRPGEALGIIGPSAAGKSTLARLLAGVWQPTAGIVRLDGSDLTCWPKEELGPYIGYLPQDVELFEGTVAENIARLTTVDSEQILEAARRADVHDMILSLPQGYDTPVGEHGMQLSPGQRQRIALARALYRNPAFVILDEPNANLDGAGEVALAQALAALRAASVTSVVVTHRPSLIAHVDKILVLEAGRIAQFGPAAEVLKGMQRRAQAVVDGKAA